MVAVRAFVSALFFAWIHACASQSTPFDLALGCGSTCTCSAQGFTDSTTVTSYGINDDPEATTKCCKLVTPQNCRGWLQAGGSCAAGEKFNLANINTATGSAAATTCCTAVTTGTCGAVTCTNRRRSDANFLMKAKTSVTSATTCNSESNCRSTCCEEKSNICATSSFACASSRTDKTFYQSCSAGGGLNAVGGTEVADATAYDTTCCEAVPTVPTATVCPSAPTCLDSTYEVDTSVSSYTYSASECCKLKTTACASLCTGSTTMFGADDCGSGGTAVCTSSTCDVADTMVDLTKVFATGDNAAAQKAACCISVSTTCATWYATRTTGAGTTSFARSMGANMAVLLVVAYARLAI